MRFEILYTLEKMGDEKVPEFFVTEALRSGDLTSRTTARNVLSTPGNPKAVQMLKGILEAR